VTASRGDGNDVRVGDAVVPPGQRVDLHLPAFRLPTQEMLDLPVTVVNGARHGPRVWLSAAIHGDELNGVEIIWRICERLVPSRMRGSVIGVPIVNVFGFLQQSRYLPDHRDLNRSFPGSARGSLASRLAHLFMTEVVAQCTHGIDFHTGTQQRTNLPQVRGDFDDPATRDCALAFNAPVMLHARLRDGSLRAAATGRGLPVLVFEGGQASRFSPISIEAGTRGGLRVLGHLGVIPRVARPSRKSLEVRDAAWIRARQGGLLRMSVALGDRLSAGTPIASVVDLYGRPVIQVEAPFNGVVIGHSTSPMVLQGDAVVNLGRLEEGDLRGGEA
jgi:predicted deacylase